MTTLAQKPHQQRHTKGAATSYISLAALLLAFATTSSARQPGEKRLPWPDAGTAETILIQVRDTFSQRYANAKTLEQKSALANHLASTAAECNNPIERWGLLMEAGRLASDTYDTELVNSIIASLADSYIADRLELQIDAILKMGKTASPHVARLLAQQTISIGEALIRNHSYEDADKLFEIMPRLLVRARDRATSADYQKIRRELDFLRDDAAKRTKQEEALFTKRSQMLRLANNPEATPESCLASGLFFCFATDEWDIGLPLLAVGSNEEIAKVARDELAATNDTELYAVAEQWAIWAETQKRSDWKTAGLEHSYITLTTIAARTTGLSRARVNERLNAVKKELGLLRPAVTPDDVVLELKVDPAAAYSLRKVCKSYTGPVITVRREKDDAERQFTSAEVRNGVVSAWCDGMDGFVTTWWDQSPNTGRNLTQTIAAYQPTIVANGAMIFAAGHPAIRWDGNDDRLETAAASLNAVRAIFVTATPSKINRTSNLVRLQSGNNITTISRFCTSQNLPAFMSFAAGVTDHLQATTPIDINNTYMLTALFSGSLTQTFINGSLSASDSGDRANPGPEPYYTVGGYGSSETLDGTLSEALIYDVDMSALRPRIEANMSSYYK